MKWLWLGLLVALLLLLGLWIAVHSGDEALPGLRISGVSLEAGTPLQAQLQTRAKIYAEQAVIIRLGPSQTTRMRRELGAALDVVEMVDRIAALRRSGSFIADVRRWWQARHGRLDLSWPPVIDEKQLGAFVARERERLEVPPKVGVSDGQGWSLPGEDGMTLDYYQASAVLKRALAGGKSEVVLELSRVPAPDPIVIGPPDGALFDTEEPQAVVVEGAARDEVPPAVYAGIDWLPSRGKECFERPPMPPFCEGPRMVPRAQGQAAAVAEALGLGGVRAVAQVLGQHALDPRWMSAAGGPRTKGSLLWPVRVGRFGRGFGFVRKRLEVRDQLHKGVDIPAPIGSAIRAASDGVVVYADNGIRGYGNLLIIAHADGSATFSAHTRRIFVSPGTRVSSGQIVAEVGLTGMTLGPHLHFEYHASGAPRDPMPLFLQVPRR